MVDTRCDGAVSRGVGATRACDLRGGVKITERWVAWDEGRSFTYEGSGIPLVSYASNEWTVYPAGAQSLLLSRAIVELKGGRLAELLEPIVRRQIRTVAARTLAAFAYLVERGEAPTIRHARLPRPATAC